MCESYTFALEYEAALAEAVDKASTLLSPNILTGIWNKVLFSVWDNCDFNLAVLLGLSTKHISYGIMGQEVTDVEDAPTPEGLPIIKRLL